MKKIINAFLICSILLMLVGCENNTSGIKFDKTYKDYYVTYNYPSIFKELEPKNEYGDIKHTYEYYKDDKLSLTIKVEEYSLGLSFSKMEEDAKGLEKDSSNKNVESSQVTINKKNFVRYSFNRDDEYGNDTLYHVYYGGYSYAGINEYIKIYFINVEGNEDIEKAFLSSFKINK